MPLGEGAFLELLDLYKLEFEDERAHRGNLGRAASGAVSEGKWNRYFTLPAHFHAGDALVKARHDATRAQSYGKRLFAVVGIVEGDAVDESATIVNFDAVSLFGGLSAPGGQLFDFNLLTAYAGLYPVNRDGEVQG